MSFYTELLDQDRINEGMDAPTPSRARILLDLFALQDMSPDERLKRAASLDAVFASFEKQWADKGWIK